ncbi:tripartite tricarboxylate transporter substrate binding protein [Achromobacter sp. ACM03]|uniref:Argininosuccinate lyase n=1 Tax=Achromobacter aegrifaciens TaxID=1287736 RepID=A0AAD2KIR8_ACHAE|nr:MULTISPECIES: tripartite tricarboxylate transporter substrate binding protein [Achromobacter]MBD9381883.1 tripartite tricarboxylate transporter substrate binding protein [Achromobacter sp. ACM02]MBD9431440.1 tripartite tricarboxylate transporter substrate binding protein [Achromobacter sp. ACM03]MDQ1758832.1 tripartite tricarboxylate transporter substrate binding protein [Achromobacter aegrifaciens]MDR7944086.1 tripartite tricarboxylate transporter substrate binding protein [Achromobacter ae
MKRTACLAAVLLSLAAPAALAAYPERAITLIVPAAAGGNADITARLVGQEMSRQLGQPVVVENRVGAGGRIGTQAVARAPADGYTIGYAHVGTLVLHRFLFKQQLYDLDRDIAAIGLVAETPNVIVVNASSPYRDLKGFIEASRAQPERLTMTSADPGTTSEVGVKLFIAQTGAAVRQIPYKATAAQLSDLLGGHVDSMMENLPPLIGNLKDGRLRALAVTTKTRAASNPDVPTVAEQGYPDYEQSAWSALVAPAGTPPEVIARLNAAMNAALRSDGVSKELRSRSQEPLGGTPQDVQNQIRKELPKWEGIIKAAGTTLD